MNKLKRIISNQPKYLFFIGNLIKTNSPGFFSPAINMIVIFLYLFHIFHSYITISSAQAESIFGKVPYVMNDDM